MTADDNAPAAAGASPENLGKTSGLNDIPSPGPGNQELLPLATGSHEDDSSVIVVDDGSGPVNHAALTLPDGTGLPEKMMVGGAGVQIRREGFYVFNEKLKHLVPISRFVAFVNEHRVRDDGVTTVSELVVQVYHWNAWHTVNVSSDDFPGLGWILTEVGPTAIIYPRSREIVQAAIQQLSGHVHDGPVPRTTVHSHLGWRLLPDGRRVYLTAGSALGPTGRESDVMVALPGDFSRYYLQVAGSQGELQRAVRASLSFLDVGPYTVTSPVLGLIYAAPMGEANATVHLVGRTGSQKSSVAAAAQQHFGADMDTEHLPGSWSSTENALEMQAFVAKDTLLVIDDFNPTGTAQQVASWHAKAERVIRAVGNGSGRSRLGADGTLIETSPARCAVLSTGEDLPNGQSLRARLLAAELQPGDIDLAKLTIAQKDAAAGTYSTAMGGYVMWLARNWESLDRSRVELFRAELHDIGALPFTQGIVARLANGLRTLLDFAIDVGAVTVGEAEAIWSRVWAALREVLGCQQEGQREADPTEKFVRFLASGISSGQAHIAGFYGGPPSHRDNGAWGWRQRPDRTVTNRENVKMDVEEGEWMPLGVCVGWRHVDRLYLDPANAMGVAEKVARQTGESLAISELTLGKRLHERGLLVVEESRDTLKSRKTIERRRRLIWDLPASLLGVGIPEEG